MQRAIVDAIQADADAVAILDAGAAQAVYQAGSRAYEVPSLDFRRVLRRKEEITEPLLIQFNGHGRTMDEVIDIGHMLERLFDRDTWYTLGGIYMRSEWVDDAPAEDGPDKHGRFHQSWDYEFEAVRSKYVIEVTES